MSEVALFFIQLLVPYFFFWELLLSPLAQWFQTFMCLRSPGQACYNRCWGPGATLGSICFSRPPWQQGHNHNSTTATVTTDPCYQHIWHRLRTRHYSEGFGSINLILLRIYYSCFYFCDEIPGASRRTSLSWSVELRIWSWAIRVFNRDCFLPQWQICSKESFRWTLTLF